MSKESRTINLGSGVKIVGQDMLPGLGMQLVTRQKACRRETEEEEMRQQQRMKTMTRKFKAKGRMDANNSWWVSALLAADCENAWFHPEWEDTMQ